MAFEDTYKKYQSLPLTEATREIPHVIFPTIARNAAKNFIECIASLNGGKLANFEV